MCPCLIRGTSVLWQMAYALQMSVVSSTSYGCGIHGDCVVFPEGLNGELEALQFPCQDLPLGNATTTDGPTQNPPLIGMVLGSMEPKTANTTLVPPSFQAIEPPHDITTVLNQHLQGPWNSFSRLLLQPHPLPLSIACLEGSHHLQLWVLHPPPEQKIHSAWRGWTWWALIQLPRLDRHP